MPVVAAPSSVEDPFTFHIRYKRFRLTQDQSGSRQYTAPARSQLGLLSLSGMLFD